MSELSNIAPCGLRLGGGLISDGEKINYLPIGNNLETGEPDYEKCIDLAEQLCLPVVNYEGKVLYVAHITDGSVIFIGLDDDSADRLATYDLNEENTVTKISSIGGGSASQSIECIGIDNLTLENPSVTAEGIVSTVDECYNRGVLPCIVANHGQLFYPHEWFGNTSSISTRAVHIDSFYSINDNGIDRINIQHNECTLTQIKFQTIENQ